MIKHIILIVVTAIPLFCSPLFSSPADEAIKEGILLLGNGSEPHSLDPHINSSMNGHHVIMSLIEGLIAPHPTDDSLPHPGIAYKWENENNTVWTFHLRDTNWTNGDPVTAHDFIYGFKRILSPRLGSQYAEMLFSMENAKAFNEGEITDFTKVGAEAIDDHTLQITLKDPIPYFYNIVKHTSWFPVNRRTVEKHGAMDDPANNWIREEYVGNGPFKLKNWQMNQIIEVEKNPDYWDAASIKLNGIKFFPIVSENTENQMFDAGALHLTYQVPADMVPIYLEKKEPTLRIDPYLGTYYYVLNVTVPPLDNPKVRKALSLAINRKTLVRRVTQRGELPATSFTPPGIKSYQPEPMESYNPKRARELLAEAGYPGGKDFPKFTLLFNTLERHKAIAEAIQQMWKQILGIDIEIRNQEWKVFIDTLAAGNYQIARKGWIGDYMYPDTFLRILKSDSGQNDSKYSNPKYDSLLESSYLEKDDRKRLEILAKAESIILDELPIIPIYYYVKDHRIDLRVKGWHPTPMDVRNYKNVYFE